MFRTDDDNGPQCCGIFLSIGPTFDDGELKDKLSEFGKITKFVVPKNIDRNGQKWPKGYGFVRFSKASEAAAALEAMNGTKFGPEDKTMYVSVLDARKEDGRDILPTLICLRFKEARSLEEVRAEYEQYGEINKVYYHKGESVINIDFKKFSGAAAAVENSPRENKPYFVLPNAGIRRSKRPYPGFDDMMMMMGGPPGFMMNPDPGFFMAPKPEDGMMKDSMKQFESGMSVSGASGKVGTLKVKFNPCVKKCALTKLFNIVPGFVSAELTDMTEDGAVATVIYDNPASAEHAADRIHELEYPPGSFLDVKLDSDSADGGGSSWTADPNMLMPDADAQKVCSTSLPDVQPLAKDDAPIVKRLFFNVVNCPTLPPNALITNLFARFGNLANAICQRGKRCGYARYCSEASARQAVQVLNGCTFMGCTLKVQEDDAK